jgi:hypothetical protein
MKVGITSITKKDIDFYRHYNEKYCTLDFNKRKTIHNYTVGEVVKINSELTHDVGYQNQLGIIVKLVGIDNYYYVMSYSTRAERYWVCGFTESEFKYLDKEIDYNSKLFKALENYLLRNVFDLCGEEFIEEYKNFMKNKVIIKENVVYVNFKT